MYSQELHWRLAAKWNEMSFEEFLKLEGPEMSRLVATYETALMIEAVTTLDANRQAKRQQRRGHSGS